MDRFFLYRLKAIQKKQKSLFSENISKREFVFNLLTSKPSEELRSGYVWHIGNVTEIPEGGLFFAVGRTTRASQEKYDERTGDFVQVDDEESPFTYAIYDQKIGALALAPKSKLAPTTKGIARNLEKLLNASLYTKENGVRIEVVEIPDPEGFIAQLHSAYAVVGFKMEFGEPNPFDVEKDFHAPMEELLSETGGDKGATNIKGQDMDRDTLETLSRSVASVGNDASARVRKAQGERPTTKHLKGDPASFLVEEFGVPENVAGILLKLRDTYRRIRRSLDDD
ncbi:hypothetical protein QQM79_16180 [Marinobacteraceae bacterium S3BR75-40.1]